MLVRLAGSRKRYFGRLWDWFCGTGSELNLEAETSEPDLEAEIEKVLECSVIIKAGDVRGNGVVVGPRKVLTALHGYYEKNKKFDVIDYHGVVRKGFVLKTWYEQSVVDIAVIELYLSLLYSKTLCQSKLIM